MHICETNDGKFIGLCELEVASVPSIQYISNDKNEAITKIIHVFHSFLVELCTYGSGKKICAEILWITEDAQSQTFRSYIRIFVLLRSIAKSRETVEAELSHMKSSLISLLKANNYMWTEDDDRLFDLLRAVDSSCIKSIVKAEQITGNMASPYPYYSCSVIPSNNTDTFELLISSLSQTTHACVSFQLFPASFSQEELYFINEQAAELQRISEGIYTGAQLIRDVSAVEPYNVLKYYSSQGSNSLFLYNICVFGRNEDTISLSSRIVSLLQEGNEPISRSDIIIVDTSSERINLIDHILFYPWNLNNKLIYTYRNQNTVNSFRNIKTLMRLPYLVTDKEALAFFRLPLYEKSMSSIKENVTDNAAEQFSNTVINEENIAFGKLASDNNIVLGCPENGFTKHMLIVGTPGSGKTTFSINILLQLARRGIPFLAIEPTKCEYRAMIDTIPELQIFTPGNNEVSPFIINPFIPPEGIRVEQYIPSLVSAFEAAFSMPSPLDVLFLSAVRSCYSEYGWKDYSKQGDADVTVFGLREFIICFRKMIRSSNYSAEVKGNLESGGFFRLMNLIEQNSNIYDTINTIPISDILSKPTVIELNSIDNSEQKALIMALLLINICIYTKNTQLGDGKLKNIFLLDEAHVLLANGTPKEENKADSSQMTIRAIQDMIAEIRAYGTGIIIADQSPVRVSREIVAMTDIKISFRLVQSTEKEIIADTTNMDKSEEEKLSRLHPGEAFVFYSAMDKAQQIVSDDIRKTENIRLVVSNDEIKTRMHYWDTRKKLLRPYWECKYSAGCKENCDFHLRSQAEYYALQLYNKNKKNIKEKSDVIHNMKKLSELIADELTKVDDDKKQTLVDCTRIKFIKRLEIDSGLRLSANEIKSCFTSETK